MTLSIDNSFVFLAAFLAAVFALLSGFGLGTILTPVFILFYDVRVAIFLVALIHLLNNFLKLALFRKHIDLEILKRFGILALVGSFLGAMGQAYIGTLWLKKLVSLVLIGLGAKEWIPEKYHFRFPKSIDPIGGFLSGLVGGLVGNQGAIRSAFLLNYPISKETYIATGVVIACVIDLVRIPVYWISYGHVLAEAWQPLTLLIIVSFSGTIVGANLLGRFSIAHFRKFVSAAIVLMGIYFLFA